MLKFNDPAVEAKYQSSFKGDPEIHLPGKKATGFKCKLSQVNLEQAERICAQPNQNLIQLKDQAAAKQTGAGKLKEPEPPAK